MMDIFANISNIFTSRDAAIIITSIVLTIPFLFKREIRDSVIAVITVALNKYLIIYLIIYLAYISSFTYAFYYFNLWDINNLKDTIIWFLFSGLPIGNYVATKKLERGFWKDTVLKSLTLVELEKFLINMYNFSLKVELVLVLIIILIGLPKIAFKYDKEYENKRYDNLKKLLNFIFVYLGFLLLLYSFCRVVNDTQSILSINTLKSFLLPAVYAIISLPFMYSLKVYSEYEKLFLNLKLGRKRSRELNSLIKWRLILFCNFDIKKLQIAANMNNYNLMSISSKDEIDVMIKTYENVLSRGTVKSKAILHSSTWITLKTPQELTSTYTISYETTLQFSDSKKEKLVGYLTELYDAKEVKVLFIPPLNTSSNGLISVDYYTDTTPTKITLNNNITNIVILTESLAEESGIPNPNVSVCAKTMNGIPLGIGNYYSSTGKANIDVSDCP